MRGGLGWPLILGGGAAALAIVMMGGDDAEASTVSGSSPPPPPPPPPDDPGARRVADEKHPIYIADDVEALARILTSEAGSHTVRERLAVGWLARNRARKKRTTIARMVCTPCGPGAGRGFSTRLPATTKNRELAALILATPAAEDPTGGATSGFEPELQDRLYRAGRKGYRLDARGVRMKWLRSMDYYGTVGHWDLFGPKGGPGARPVPAEWGLDEQPPRREPTLEA
jgi:hypothetical protein